MPCGIITTLGYAEPNAQEHVQTFMDQGDTALIDIRDMPHSRWNPYWNKANLQQVYGELRYAHLKNLGNVNYRQKGGPIVLLNPDEDVVRVARVVQSGISVMLLCACKEYERCHRKVVYERIQDALHTLNVVQKERK